MSARARWRLRPGGRSVARCSHVSPLGGPRQEHESVKAYKESMGDKTVDPEAAVDLDEKIREEIREEIRAKQRAPSSEETDESEDTEPNMRKASMSMFLSDFGRAQ
jgi:hypothetical protein